MSRLSLIFLLSLLVIILVATSLVSAQRRTLTPTMLAIRPGTLSIEAHDLQWLRLSRAGVFPPAYIEVRILNTTYSFADTDCQTALSISPFISGKGWLGQLVPASPFTQLEPSLVRITLVGTALFDAKNFWREGRIFSIQLPSACTSGILSSTLNFELEDTENTQIAGIAAFSLLLAGTVNFLAVLGGSQFAYVPVQIAVLIVANGCAPIDVQRESYSIGFVMAPLPYTNRDRRPHYRSLMTNLLIFIMIGILETIHFLVRYRSSPAYAQRLVASLKGKRDVFFSTYKPQPGDKFPIPPDDVPKRPMPGYFLFCAFVCFGGGTVYHATRVLSYEATEAQQYVAAGVGVIVWIIFFAASISLSVTKGAYYKTFSSSKKKLPRVITPDGCVGPNVFRLSFGVIVADMRQGRRYAASLPLLYVGVMAALTGSTAPSASGCRTTLSLSWLITFLFAIFMYRSQPLRSTAANFLAVAMMVGTLFVIACLLVYAGYGGNTSPNSSSGPMTIISVVVLAVLAVFNGIINIIVSLWESSGGGESMRCARYSDTRSGGIVGVGQQAGEGEGVLAAVGAEVFERHVAFLVDDMKQLIEAGGGAPLEPDDAGPAHNLFAPSGGGSGTENRAPTLATFLLQDFDALP